MASLKKLAIRGATWTLLGYGLAQVLRLGSNLILTRLLFPELFGLMALVNTFITGLNLFSDIGIGPSIIQNRRGDEPTFLNTAWTLQVIRGFGLWIGCLVIAWPVAQIYSEPRLLWLIPITGLSTILAGFNSTAIFTLNRKMSLGKLTVLEIGVQVIALGIMVVWAWFSPTIWALVAGNFASGALKMVWSHRLSDRQDRFTWDRSALKDIISFGRWIFVSTMMAFLAAQADRLILGKLFSFELLGIYTVAFTLADLPRTLIQQISHKVIFPIVSQQSELPRQTLKAKIQSKRTQILLVLGLIVVVIVAFGDLIIFKLYDDRYEQAGWMLQFLGIGIWPIVLSAPMSRCLNAIGKPQYLACAHCLRFLFVLVFLPIGFQQMGVLGAIIIVALNDLPTYGVITYGLWREKLLLMAQDIRATGLLLGLTALLIGGRILVGLELPQINLN